MDIQKLIDDYATWLKQEITFEKVGEYYEITTPYLDSANDYLQIYVRQIGDDIYFTDDSATIRNLKMAGFQFTPARKSHLQRILNQYGVRLDGDELICKAPANSFAQKNIYLFKLCCELMICLQSPSLKLPHSFLTIFKSSLIRKRFLLR